MPACDTCGKDFERKAGLDAHKKRKTPCQPPVALIQKTLADAGIAEPLTEFREGSKKFHESLSKESRQEQGIFFTPKKVRDRLFETLIGVRPKRILEPSFGSGEFLLDARRLYPDATLVGVEKNADLFASVKIPGADLVCADFLDWKGTADLIIGNPPYFVLKTLGKKYSEAMTGRPNIYILFLYKCLTEHLTKDGVLAFIVPTSLYNCSYYQPLRNYIAANTTIRHLETLDKPGFYETGQDTTLIVLENRKGGDNYLFRGVNGSCYISPFYKELATLAQGSTTLSALGLGVKTGNVVWNQVKEHLVDEGGVLLIYSSNIKESALELGSLRGEKKQYVAGLTKPTLSGPVILVERGYGNSFRFNCVLTDRKEFYAENHVNVIYAKTPGSEAHMARVYKSLQDERCRRFMELFLGNGSISATDMETLVPIL